MLPGEPALLAVSTSRSNDAVKAEIGSKVGET